MFNRANKTKLADEIAKLAVELSQLYPAHTNGKYFGSDFGPETTEACAKNIKNNFAGRTFTAGFLGTAEDIRKLNFDHAYITVLQTAKFETIEDLFNTKHTSDWLNSERCSYLKNRNEKLWFYAGLRVLQEVLEKPELLSRLFTLQFGQTIKFAIAESIIDFKEKDQQGQLHIGLAILDLAIKHQYKEIAALMYRNFIRATENQLNAMHTMGVKIAEINQEREQEILARHEELEKQQRTSVTTEINTEAQIIQQNRNMAMMQEALGANFNNQVITYELYAKLEEQNSILQNRVDQLEQQLQLLIAKIGNSTLSNNENKPNLKFF